MTMIKTDFTILYEDSDIVIIDKPYGVVVNRAETIKEYTVQDWMGSRLEMHHDGHDESKTWQSLIPADFDHSFGTPSEIFAQRQGLVHRLDKDTSGALVLAKNPGSLVNLLKQFRERLVTKQYLCLVHGKFSQESGEVNAPIARLSKNRKLFGVVADGRAAVTQFKVESFYPDLDYAQVPQVPIVQARRLYQGFSLVACWPKTGRTHQIRVHMKHLQHPLVGDAQYVGKKRARLDHLWCLRQFLHASRLTFAHPRTGINVEIHAPLPDDLAQVLQLLVKS